jgi:aryl-alcohol dehydrogenase-like predicted oxidoreductase
MRYTLLGRSGLRVSELCLGTMTFGGAWGWGSPEDICKKQLHRFFDRGGNFVDTANRYTDGQSEEILGRLLEGRRDEVVLATKYTLCTRPGDPNAGGNARKNMMQSVSASLERLRADYIDLYWVHAWDMLTPIDEVMRALDDLVRSGRVHYVGVSDFPAWKVSEANTLSDLRGWSPFVGLQVEYSLAERDVERELIPMARDLKLGVTPWSPLAGGLLTGKYSRGDLDASELEPGERPKDRRQMVQSRLTERRLLIADAVAEVAAEVGHSPAQVALRWVMDRPGVTSTILGARTTDQLEDNLGSLDVALEPDQRARPDAASEIDLGFPHDMLMSPRIKGFLHGGVEIEPYGA